MKSSASFAKISPMLRLTVSVLAFSALGFAPLTASATDAEPVAGDAPAATEVVAAPPAETAPAQEAKAEQPESHNYYVERRSYGTKRVSEPPPYVKQLNQTWLGEIDGFKDIDWLDIGLDHRTRFEIRDNDFRRNINTVDQPFLLRTRAYLAVKNKFDPLRFTVEISDARRFNSDFPRDVRDSNFQEPIQLCGELFFKQSWVADKQLSLKFGRQAFEYTDRRLLARNEFRNTTNNFDGIRAILGKQSDEWQLDALLLQPILRDDNGFDKRDKANTLLGLIGDYRGISQYITLQPLYLVLKQDGKKVSTGIEREIHTIGLRGYGIVGKTGFDYDFSYNKQVGNDGPREHDALGYTGELGYTFAQPWKPRLSAAWNYGSGDDNPNDQQSGRFERLFGFARPFSQDDYFQFENIEATKLHFELTPSKTVQWDAGFSWYSLNSATDRWNNAGLRDPTGQSGTYVGHEADTRLVWTPSRYFQTELLYAYFKSGTFAENAGRGGTSNLFFAQFTFSAF